MNIIKYLKCFFKIVGKNRQKGSRIDIQEHVFYNETRRKLPGEGDADGRRVQKKNPGHDRKCPGREAAEKNLSDAGGAPGIARRLSPFDIIRILTEYHKTQIPE